MQLGECYKVNRPVELPADQEIEHGAQSRSQHPTLPGSCVPLNVAAPLIAIDPG